MNRTLGQKMKLLRDKRHFTQEQMSTLLHVGRSAYANYEKDKREPSIDFLVTLAKFHHVTVDYLISGSYNPTHSQYQEIIRFLSVFQKLSAENQTHTFSYMTYLLQNQLITQKNAGTDPHTVSDSCK